MRFLAFLIIILIFISCSDSSSTKTDYCRDNPCKDSPVANKTVCKELDNDFTCICEDGYIWNLEVNLCVRPEVNPCDENPCQNSEIEHKTVCEPISDNFKCVCEAGYTLDSETNQCIESETNLCDPNPCTTENKTKCTVVGEGASASPKCNCNDGYVLDGENCIEDTTEQKFKLRIMAANLTTSIYQDYEYYGTSIMDAMDPDIILIQEFNYDLNFDGSTSDSEVEAMITEIYGPNSGVHYYRGRDIILEPGDIPIPNGIISKYPILETGEWSDIKVPNRNFNYAKIDIPGDKDLWAISLHLKAGSSDDGVRNLETKELIQKIQYYIPEGDYIVIGGDLNTKDRNEDTITNLSSIFKTEGPHPVDEVGKEGTNRSRRNPYDWVIADKTLALSQISTDFCYDEILEHCKRYPNGLVFDSTKYDEFDLEVFFQPVEVDDSRGGEMQHMGVVKDFLIEY